jgi:hypothetical protein
MAEREVYGEGEGSDGDMDSASKWTLQLTLTVTEIKPSSQNPQPLLVSLRCYSLI